MTWRQSSRDISATLANDADTGVVHEHVEAAEALNGGIDETLRVTRHAGRLRARHGRGCSPPAAAAP